MNTMESLLEELKEKNKGIRLGGGLKKIAKHKAKGKMTAFERIQHLIDKDKAYIEIGIFAGDGMYEEEGGCPNGGVVCVMGHVSGRLCVILSNDATVKAGAWFPITGKKCLRAQEIAMENRLPIIYLVDSAGIYLPLQSDIFADKEHFGRVFRNNAKLSAMGVPQISAIMGSCVAGGAYLPIMSDYTLIVKGTGSVYLAGPYLVKSSIGEVVDSETLGGAFTQSAISGVTDNMYDDDASCLDAIKGVMDKMGHFEKAGFNRKEAVKPKKEEKEIYSILPTNKSRPYDMLEVIERLVDGSDFEQYKKDYGKSILCGWARIDGWSVGIVANQRIIVKANKPGNSKEMQVGGVIYSDSADKAARFIMNCNQQHIPLVFLQDVTGFMVGSRSEQGGIIKDGAKLVTAISNSVVPKFTFIVGNSYGAGNYAMCGKAYDPRLIYAWPGSQMAVMSGAVATETLFQIEQANKNKNGRDMESIRRNYEEQLSPYYAAARLWTDGVIDPLETRKIISIGIEAANHAPIKEEFKLGLIQT